MCGPRCGQVLWAALRPHLTRMENWDGMVAITMRSGFADHVGNFPEASSPLPRPGGSISGLGFWRGRILPAWRKRAARSRRRYPR